MSDPRRTNSIDWCARAMFIVGPQATDTNLPRQLARAWNEGYEAAMADLCRWPCKHPKHEGPMAYTGDDWCQDCIKRDFEERAAARLEVSE